MTPCRPLTSRESPPVSHNASLLDIEVFRDYGQIEVSDVIGRDLPQRYGQTTGVVFTDHTVDVFTMSVDQAVERDQNVRVRVDRGTDTAAIGTPGVRPQHRIHRAAATRGVPATHRRTRGRRWCRLD